MKALLKRPLLLFIVLALVVVLGFVAYRRIWRNRADSGIKNKNVLAFIETVFRAEGTWATNGHRYLFGSTYNNEVLFNDLSEHPNQARTVGGYTSTAAGQPQILYKTWVWMGKGMLGLTDFSKASQWKFTVGAIYYRNALQLVIDGKFEQAIALCSWEWASLPPSRYGQGTRSMDQLKQWYENAGGKYHPQ